MGRHYASIIRKKTNDRVFVSGPEDSFLAVKKDGTVVRVGRELYQDSEYGFAEEVHEWKDIVALACADKCLLGLKGDGTVECASINWSCGSVKEWTDIADIDLGCNFAVGLTTDGHVKITGLHHEDVGSWSDIAAVTASRHVVGLKEDGTVMAEGDNEYGQCDVSGWRDIVTVACGSFHTVGLKSDGTVVAVGGSPETDGEGGSVCDVTGWTDIVDIAAEDKFTIGLRADGTVVTAGAAPDVSGWRDIIAVNVSCGKVFGIRRDGRVAGFEDEEGWQDIVAVRHGWRAMVGLKKDGTAVGKVLIPGRPITSCVYADEGYSTDTIPQNLAGPWTGWQGIAAEAERGELRALVRLAGVHSDPDCEAYDRDKTVDYLERAERILAEAEAAGEPEASDGELHGQMGDAYYEFADEGNNRQLAFDHFCKSLAAGELISAYDVAWMYFKEECDGPYFTWSADELMGWMKEQEEESDTPFLGILLGDIYFEGLRRPQDKEEAAVWYRSAWEKDDYDSGWQLAECYFDTQQYEKYFEILQELHEEGDYEATYRLGECYESGMGVEKDPEKGKQLKDEADMVYSAVEAASEVWDTEAEAYD